MNKCIVDLFNNKIQADKLAEGLPTAFEMASIELPSGNPAVGVLREHALIGYFQDCFGINKVETPVSGIKRGHDVIVCGHLLSIKTVKGNGSVKVLWTADNRRVDEEIETKYKANCDMFLVRIFWDKNKPSVFYIPEKTQNEVMQELGREHYLVSNRGTNNRGISISSQAMKILQKHNATITMNINWIRKGLNYTPYDRWVEYWKHVN